MRGAAAGARQPLVQRLEIVRGVDVEPKRGQLDDFGRHAGRVRVGHVAPAAVRTEARREHVRRDEQQRVGAGAVPVRDDQRRALAGRAGEQLLELSGIEQRAVSGHEKHPLDPVLERGMDSLRRSLVVPALVVLDDARAVPGRDPLGHAIAADHDDPLERGHPA